MAEANNKLESHATTAAGQKQMEPANVFAEYLQLFDRDHQQFCLYLAPNAVLSWFGRNIKGAAKINEFLRYTVSTQYKHISFGKVAECEPIERTPSQHKTKVAAATSAFHVNPKNIVPQPKSLKLYADSAEEDNDDDDADLGVKPLLSTAREKTPERRTRNTIIEALTPPASGTKADDAFSSATDDEEDFNRAAHTNKKRTHTHRPATSTTRHSKRKRLSPKDMHLLLADSSSDDEDGTAHQTGEASFTPLRYLQAQGLLVTQAKHGNDSDVEEFDESGVRIRISYRRVIADKTLQFALIIYEQQRQGDSSAAAAAAGAQTRRNLMSAFNETIEDIKQTVASATVGGSNEVLGDHVNDDDDDDDYGEPAFLINTETDEQVIATVTEPNTAEIAAALETAAFNIAPMRTPTKTPNTPPPTPKRKPRSTHFMTGLKRLNMSPLSSTPAPKRSAAKSLRL